MSHEPHGPANILRGITGLIVALVVLASTLPIITPYVVAIGIVVAVVRLIWFYTGRW